MSRPTDQPVNPLLDAVHAAFDSYFNSMGIVELDIQNNAEVYPLLQWIADSLGQAPEARAGDCDWKCVRTEVTPMSPVVLLDGQPPHDPPTYKIVRYWQATIGKRTEEISQERPK